jgi:integrase
MLIPIPETARSVLIETSFADAIEIISNSAELPELKRRHWSTSLRQVGKLLGKPLALIPARYSGVRADLRNLHHVPAEMSEKTLQNHKSNAKTALLWLAGEKGIPEHGAPLAPAWVALQAEVNDALLRMRLSPLLRFASANGIAPDELDEAVMDRFMAYRRTTGQKAGDNVRRLIARAWNAAGETMQAWPKRELAVPAPKQKVEVPWESFPAGLRAEIEAYLKTLMRVRKGRTGQRIAPAKPSTLITRRRELQATARMALKVGVAIEELTSLSALLNPDVAERVLDTYWEKNGELPKLFTVDLANRFVLIAIQTGCLTAAECDALRIIRGRFPQARNELDGMTEKNIAFLRQVLTDGVWGRVVKLPYAMMEEAKRLQNRSKFKAAVMAQLAIAIAIETIAPVRLANLVSIRLGIDLIRPGGPKSNYWLVLPKSQVKNRVNLSYPLTNDVTNLIEDYIQNFWPVLQRGRDEAFLFPGLRNGAKEKISFSGQISRAIQKWTGLRMTTHQFRHAAGAIILKRRPGEYELVRQLLGHKNIQTTMKAYIGLDSIHASEVFTGMITDMISPRLKAAE